MNVRALADAVLHEGYALYPYDAASLKNQHRYLFGTLYPASFCEAQNAGDVSVARLECLARGSDQARFTVEARFLQLQPGEAIVREVSAPRFTLDALSGELRFETIRAADGFWKLIVELINTSVCSASASRDEALAASLVAAHLLVRADGAELVSSIDPPENARHLAESCKSSGLWPVLVGRPGSHDTLLAAPIILYDYPQLAPESAGDFFDGTEIDALLTLRVLTLTEDEKRVMSEGEPRIRALLERTEAEGLSRLEQLHGRLEPRPVLRPGARVLLRPKGRADIFDLALDGKHATVEKIERDLEGKSYVAVTIDDDPGKDLGAYGHRFFFRPEEVELL